MIKKLNSNKYNSLLTIILNLAIVFILIFVVACNGSDKSEIANTSINNEYNTNENFTDLLTPEYYSSAQDNSLKVELDNFLLIVRKIKFHHPLENSLGDKPSFSVPENGEFGADKATFQHHAAVDLHIDGDKTNVVLYAAYDGYVKTYRDADKYRNYLSLFSEVRDESNNVIGHLLTLYAHIDLDLDEADSLYLNDVNVSKGDIISKHLYSDTLGGPHLHFEIRYYRASDNANEDFYGSKTLERTKLSSGPWSYGYWNPEIGFGFANPKNHNLYFYDE